MKKEWNLSDKGLPIREKKPNIVYAEGDIKEFIKRLKEKLHCVRKDNLKDEVTEGERFANMSMHEVELIINTLAGDKLT